MRVEQLTLNQRVQGSKSLCAHHIKSLKLCGVSSRISDYNMDVLRKVPKRFQECAVRSSASGCVGGRFNPATMRAPRTIPGRPQGLEDQLANGVTRLQIWGQEFQFSVRRGIGKGSR